MAEASLQSVSTCIGCGCTDKQACVDPETLVTCCWVRLERAAGVGVCSCCGEDLDRWDRGDREVLQPLW